MLMLIGAGIVITVIVVIATVYTSKPTEKSKRK